MAECNKMFYIIVLIIKNQIYKFDLPHNFNP